MRFFAVFIKWVIHKLRENIYLLQASVHAEEKPLTNIYFLQERQARHL